MGKLHTKGVLENHLKDQSFRLVHWLSITPILRKTYRDCINLERKSYLDCSLDTLCTREEFGRVTCWLQTLRRRIRNLLWKTQCKRGDISQRKWKIHFSSRRWTNQNPWRRSGTENAHLYTGTPNSRRRSKRLSRKIRRVSSTTSRLTSGCWWSTKWFFWSISGNFVFRHHVEPRVKLYSPREESFTIPLKCIDVSRTTLTNLDVMQERRNRRLLDHRWAKRFVWFLDRFHSVYFIRRVKPPDGYMWSGRETDKTASDIQARPFLAGTLERNGK